MGSLVRAPLSPHLKPGAEPGCRGWFEGCQEKTIKAQLEWFAQQPLNNAELAIKEAEQHKPLPKPVYLNQRNRADNVDEVQIKRLLDCISPNCDFLTWLKIGMILHHEGLPVQVWDDWSAQGGEYKGIADLEKHWANFGMKDDRPRVGLRTLHWLAKNARPSIELRQGTIGSAVLKQGEQK